MSKVYLSFLGTNDYVFCTYFLGDQEARNVRFVQEATTQFCCQDWTSEDRILIFTTDDAFRKNWLDNGHTDRKGKVLERVGLKRCLEQLNLKPLLEKISILEGKSLNEIWKIFEIVFGQLAPNDEIVFDITHALRSIPMLAMVVLNYAKVMKGVTLLGIYYGAFEILGRVEQARKIPLEDRRAPIFNLTPFDTLLDWTLAIDRFLGAGDSSPVSNLSRRAINPVLKATKGRNQAAATIRDLGNKLEAFTRVMSTCRGQKIVDVVKDLKEQIFRCEGLDILPPFQPLLGKIGSELSDFTGDVIADGIQAVKWCYGHNLIQQGYTILREVLISYLATKAGCDYLNKNCREIAPQAVKVFNQNLSKEDWKPPASENPAVTARYLDYLKNNPEMGKIFGELVNYRNDIDHAGYKDNPMKAEQFGQKLKELIAKIEEHLR